MTIESSSRSQSSRSASARLSSLEGLDVGGYRTAFLRRVRRDPLPGTLEGPSFYLTTYATDEVLARRGVPEPPNRVLGRKKRTAEMLPSPCTILSLVRSRDGWWRLHGELEEREGLVHIPCVSGTGADLVNSVMLTLELVRRRDEFRTLAFYNFYFYLIPAAWVASRILGKQIVVDFQDDYDRRSGFWGSKLAFRILSPLVDAVIAIVEPMMENFPADKPVAVVNSFADLSYVEEALDREVDRVQLLYAGSLDAIRGGDLLVPLSDALRDRGVSHHLHVAGKGPFVDQVRRLAERSPDVTYHGFLSSEELHRLMERVDVGLVLQKPDHPFTRGSFPSKVGVYADAGLPPLVLVEDDD